MPNRPVEPDAHGLEVVGSVEGVAADGGRGLDGVRLPGGVAEVEKVLTGQAPPEGLEDSETADAGVEDSDRALEAYEAAINRLLSTNGLERSRWPVSVGTSWPPKRICTAVTSGQLRTIESTMP